MADYPASFLEHLTGIGAQTANNPNLAQQWQQWQGASGYQAPNAAAQSTPTEQSTQYPEQDLVAIDLYNMQLQAATNAAQEKYLRRRLEMLEIPQFQQQTALERHNLAIQLAAQRAAATGFWIEPEKIVAGLLSNPATATIVPAQVRGEQDIAGIREQMRNAGYPRWNTA